MTTATLTLPRTRIGWQGGGRAVMRLICCCNGLCRWHHLCLHSQNNGAKDNGRDNRQGRCANNRGREKGGTPRPHQQGATKTKTKSKTKFKTKTKTKTKTETETKSTSVVATSPHLGLQTATPMLLLLMPLRKQRQQRRQHRGSSGSSSSRVVAAAAHYFELPCSFTASGIKFPFLICQYPSEKMILGTKTVTELPQLHTYLV
jgi:hypothetical protein